MNAPFSGRRVLVVEDEMIVAWLLQDMLADFGCAVVGPAASINEALVMIDAEAFDVAMLDVNLNGKMSYPIADALISRGVPFLFSTGYDKDRLQDGYRTVPVLQKPYHRAELENTLARLLALDGPGVGLVMAGLDPREKAAVMGGATPVDSS